MMFWLARWHISDISVLSQVLNLSDSRTAALVKVMTSKEKRLRKVGLDRTSTPFVMLTAKGRNEILDELAGTAWYQRFHQLNIPTEASNLNVKNIIHDVLVQHLTLGLPGYWETTACDQLSGPELALLNGSSRQPFKLPDAQVTFDTPRTRIARIEMQQTHDHPERLLRQIRHSAAELHANDQIEIVYGSTRPALLHHYQSVLNGPIPFFEFDPATKRWVEVEHRQPCHLHSSVLDRFHFVDLSALHRRYYPTILAGL